MVVGRDHAEKPPRLRREDAAVLTFHPEASVSLAKPARLFVCAKLLVRIHALRYMYARCGTHGSYALTPQPPCAGLITLV